MYTYRILTPTYFAKNEYVYDTPRNLIEPFILCGEELIVHQDSVAIFTSKYSLHTISFHTFTKIEKNCDLTMSEIRIVPSSEEKVDLDVLFVSFEKVPLPKLNLSDDDLKPF